MEHGNKNIKQKQSKVQSIYRMIKNKNTKKRDDNKFGVFGVVIVIIWIIVLSLNAIFDI
ncbi:hypothetical protein [Cytobacillus oceanisediminis]|uniref:hypothetical protein n=1 Tax=Cytobacillus oceanisediminis TaxID=665099 RepID=UPI00203FB12D|nr:hypothetical protein [Cytobacillus oceanisediminis]MCM3393163.1 hypothetical protein [Cytobacillus oceanisediminis]